MTPDPYDLAITLSQRLADLLSPVEMARLRTTCQDEITLGVQSTAALDFHEATGRRLPYVDYRRAIAWALERYGVDYNFRRPLNNPANIHLLVREAIRIARSHGYVVEAIIDSQEVA